MILKQRLYLLGRRLAGRLVGMKEYGGRFLPGRGKDKGTRMREAGNRKGWRQARRRFAVLILCAAVWGGVSQAQENPLGEVQTQAPPPAKKTPEETKPVIEGASNVAAHATANRNSRIRVDVNLVLVPATVTDPMNRLVTGLEKREFSGLR